MKKITVIDTGGTFNKVYNHIKGDMEVEKEAVAIREIIKYMPNIEFDIEEIIRKDSLDFQDSDRESLLRAVLESKFSDVIIIHGTDTMDVSAKFLDGKIEKKRVVFTGAMVPFSINRVEATLNFSLGVGFLVSKPKDGIYISMHGLVEKYQKIFKNRGLGVFQKR